MELASKSNQVYLLVKMLVPQMSRESSREGGGTKSGELFPPRAVTLRVVMLRGVQLLTLRFLHPTAQTPLLPPRRANLVNVNAVSHVKAALKLIIFDLFGLTMLLRVHFKMLKVAQSNRFFVLRTGLR